MDILSDVSFYGDLDIKQNLLFKIRTSGIKLGREKINGYLAFQEIDPQNNMQFYITPSFTQIYYSCSTTGVSGGICISNLGIRVEKMVAYNTSLDAFPAYVNISVPSGCNEFAIREYTLYGDYNYMLYPRVFVYKNNKKVEMDIELKKTGGTEILIGKIENGSTESEDYVFIIDGIQ